MAPRDRKSRAQSMGQTAQRQPPPGRLAEDPGKPTRAGVAELRGGLKKGDKGHLGPGATHHDTPELVPGVAMMGANFIASHRGKVVPDGDPVGVEDRVSGSDALQGVVRLFKGMEEKGGKSGELKIDIPAKAGSGVGKTPGGSARRHFRSLQGGGVFFGSLRKSGYRHLWIFAVKSAQAIHGIDLKGIAVVIEGEHEIRRRGGNHDMPAFHGAFPGVVLKDPGFGKCVPQPVCGAVTAAVRCEQVFLGLGIQLPELPTGLPQDREAVVCRDHDGARERGVA